MELIEEFELLKDLADKAGLLQTDILYRRSDGLPSMKKRVIDGAEVREEKPIKSIHHIEITSLLILRVRRSNKERKGHLEALLKIIQDEKLEQLDKLFGAMVGIERGKNIHWRHYNVVPNDHSNFKEYLTKVKEENEKPNTSVRPAVGDDLVLVEGWEVEISA